MPNPSVDQESPEAGCPSLLRNMSRSNLPTLLVLCLFPLCARTEVADKLPTVQDSCRRPAKVIVANHAFAIAYRARWPWLAVAVPCLALLAALRPAIESDIAVYAEQELGSGYLAQAEDAEWLLPLIATMGLLGVRLLGGGVSLNMPIDSEPPQQPAASLQVVVARSSLR